MSLSMAMEILVIEDDVDTRENLRDILEIDSHRVEAAGTLEAAFDKLRAKDFSCILLDRRLPDGTADDALPRLRQLTGASIVVVTGYADIDGTIAALRHGASDYVVKPINADVIRSSLNRIARLKDAEERALQAERLAAIGQMVASMAHESRNFLQRIYAASEFLQELVEDNTEALEEVERIQSAEKGLEHLLEEMREFAGPMKLERVGCSIESVWKRAWSEVSAAKNVCDVQFNEDVDDVDLSCHIDEFRIAQVFRNLFENSLAACDESPQIQVLCQNSGGTLKIAIRDNGPGLTTEQQQNVFQPFFTTKAKGTGLGMAIVERIVESHGGSIRVETGYADGAEFILTLPTGHD